MSCWVPRAPPEFSQVFPGPRALGSRKPPGPPGASPLCQNCEVGDAPPPPGTPNPGLEPIQVDFRTCQEGWNQGAGCREAQSRGGVCVLLRDCCLLLTGQRIREAPVAACTATCPARCCSYPT